MSISQEITRSSSQAISSPINYQTIVAFFDKNWTTACDNKSIERMKKLDMLFSSPSKKLTSVQISGSNGKSLTAHFATKLLVKEGFTVGTFYGPHINSYNERFAINGSTISDDDFVILAQEVIQEAEKAKIIANTYELLTQMAFNYFAKNNVDIVLLEASHVASYDATALCSPKIVAITRIADSKGGTKENASLETIEDYLKVATSETHIIAADQNKTHLKYMADWIKIHGGHWAMPIRKLVPLHYPFEQLHGRCAALAERIVSIYINDYLNKQLDENSFIAKKKGQRGRPTLEAKKQLELNPKYTLENFWKETTSNLPGRFQLLDQEKPTILLDNADNIDALENLLLGIRLVNYQRTIKGVALLIGCHQETINLEEFVKVIRQFFRKTTGTLTLCPLGIQKESLSTSWDLDFLQQELNDGKFKLRIASSFKEGFEAAKKSINDKQGLLVITGSSAMLEQYWKLVKN